MAKFKNCGTVAEVRMAKRLGARLTPASGAIQGAKGDAILETEGGKVMIENKATEAFQMILQYGWLNKLAEEAFVRNSSPTLAIQFVTGNGKPRRNGDWVMITEAEYRKLVGS